MKITLAENQRAVIGDNNPPEDLTPFEALTKRKDELFDGINRFVKANPSIDTQEEIDKVSDFKVQLTTLAKDIDNQRKAEKKPHLDAGRAVDTKYSPLEQIVAKGVSRVVDRLTAAMQAMNKKREEERLAAEAEQKRKQEEADKAAREAAKLAMQAEDGALPADADLMGAEQKALELQAAADAQQQEVRGLRGNVKGGTGEVDGKKKTVSLHTYYSAKVTDPKAALNFFFAQAATKPKILNLIQELADAAVRAAAAKNDFDNIPPGVEVASRQQAQ